MANENIGTLPELFLGVGLVNDSLGNGSMGTLLVDTFIIGIPPGLVERDASGFASDNCSHEGSSTSKFGGSSDGVAGLLKGGVWNSSPDGVSGSPGGVAGL